MLLVAAGGPRGTGPANGAGTGDAQTGDQNHDHDDASGHDHDHDHDHEPGEVHDHDHEHAAGDEHDHDHAPAAKNSSIELSPAGLKNIGFQPAKVSLEAFERTETLPAIVVERPGNTVPRNGAVDGRGDEVLCRRGRGDRARQPDVRSAADARGAGHSQQEFLKTAESLDVVDREIAGCSALGEGVVAGKRMLEQQYEKQKLEASLSGGRAGAVAARAHEEQVADIPQTRKLLQSLTVCAAGHVHGGRCGDDHLFHVQQIAVSPGEQVEAGQELCVLADHCELMVEGRAFEDDATLLRACDARRLGRLGDARWAARARRTESTA